MSAVRALFSFLRNGIIFRFRLITFGNIHFYIFSFFPELERIRTRRGANYLVRHLVLGCSETDSRPIVVSGS